MEKIYSFLSSLKVPSRWVILSLAWFLLAGVVLTTTPVLGLDQPRYLNIAWNMLLSHHYFVTYSPYIPYSPDHFQLSLQKPPLFYWFIVGGWKLFGVNNAWPHIVTAIFGWINLVLIYWLARQWYPNQPRIAWFAVLILFSSFIWPAFSAYIRFEHLIVVFGLLYCNLIVKAILKKSFWFTVAAGTALGFGLLAKGPVILVYILPLVVVIPFSLSIPLLQVYPRVVGSFLLAIIVPFCWLFSLYSEFGYGPVHYFLHQASHRVSGAEDINYFKSLLLLWRSFIICFLPWTFLINLWINKRGWKAIFNRRNVAIVLPVLITIVFFFFFVPRKAIRYFIPIYPFFALMLANMLEGSWEQKAKPFLFYHLGLIFVGIGVFLLAVPYLPHFSHLSPIFKEAGPWAGGIILASGLLFFYPWRLMGEYYLLLAAVFYVSFFVWQTTWQRAMAKPMSFERMATAVKQLQDQNLPVIQYCAEPCILKVRPLLFLGRQRQPVPLLHRQGEKQLRAWLAQHNNGWVVVGSSHSPACAKPFLHYRTLINDNIAPDPNPKHLIISRQMHSRIEILSLIDAKNFKTCTIDLGEPRAFWNF